MKFFKVVKCGCNPCLFSGFRDGHCSRWRRCSTCLELLHFDHGRHDEDHRVDHHNCACWRSLPGIFKTFAFLDTLFCWQNSKTSSINEGFKVKLFNWFRLPVKSLKSKIWVKRFKVLAGTSPPSLSASSSTEPSYCRSFTVSCCYCWCSCCFCVCCWRCWCCCWLCCCYCWCCCWLCCCCCCCLRFCYTYR